MKKKYLSREAEKIKLFMISRRDAQHFTQSFPSLKTQSCHALMFTTKLSQASTEVRSYIHQSKKMPLPYH